MKKKDEVTCFVSGKVSFDITEQIGIKHMMGLLLRPIRLMVYFFGVKI